MFVLEGSENVMSFIYDLAVTGRDWRRRRIHITSFSQFTTHLFFVVKYGGDPRGTLFQILKWSPMLQSLSPSVSLAML